MKQFPSLFLIVFVSRVAELSMPRFAGMTVCKTILGLGLLASAFASYNIDEDVQLDPVGLLRKYGYPAETHEVTTEDGYILTLHRVPRSPSSSAGSREAGGRKPAVFLQHGILCSSADWVVMGPGVAPAYVLADAGYDVWMGNARGNKYSRRHKTLSPDGLFNSKFWDFDWHEMGIYDMPASIDYVLEATGEEKLFYIGHSMGTTLFWVMNSVRPEYNTKFRAMFALAPEIYVGHIPQPLVRAAAYVNKPAELIFNLIGYNEVRQNKLFKKIFGMICKLPYKLMCDNPTYFLFGYDLEEVNSTMLPVIMSHMPAGTSSKTLLHFEQEVLADEFQMWDYGLTNIFHYGSLSPPKYNISKVTAPVAIHYSVGDRMNDKTDLDRLFNDTINPIGKFKVPRDTFSHMDYLWGIHSKELVYDQIISLMSRF